MVFDAAPVMVIVVAVAVVFGAKASFEPGITFLKWFAVTFAPKMVEVEVCVFAMTRLLNADEPLIVPVAV